MVLGGDRRSGGPVSGEPVPSENMLVFEHGDGGIEALERFARQLIIPGFLPLDSVLEYVAEWIADGGRIPLAQAEAATRRIWRERLAEQRNWTEPGDYNRLLLAYADLESQGILARMNFTCCKQCATTEIDFERTAHPNPPDWYRYREWAYVYFHQQDGDRLAEDNPELLFGYSAFRLLPGTPAEIYRRIAAGDRQLEDEVGLRTDTEVGRRIVAAFTRQGLRVSWGGDPDTRIGVRIDAWRKPLPEFDE